MGGFRLKPPGGDLCQVAVAETVEPQEPEAPEEPEEAAEEAHVFLHFFNRFWCSLKQGFRLFLWIVLFCLNKNRTKGLIQGMEGGMNFGSSVIIRRKVYIVTVIIVPERSCRVRWAVLHNPMTHFFWG